MLKLIKMSKSKKLADCAVTYRAGDRSPFGTCPASCTLNPIPERSVQTVDRRYLTSLLAAVPREGVSFTYTHFHPIHWGDAFKLRLGSGKPTTIVNYSTSSAVDALAAYHRGLPVVMALPAGSERKVAHLGPIRVIRCPAEYQHITCKGCGNGSPLCARPDRDYIIGFYAHGPGAKYVSRPTQGGCYAFYGHTRAHWNDTVGTSLSESTQLATWVDGLPKGTVLRHHVAGDLGERL